MTAPDAERLNRFLARRGVASRRQADTLIASGRVTVNGAQGRVGSVVSPQRDTVHVDGRRIAGSRVAVTIVLNKPAGVVVTRRDPQRRPTVMSLVDSVPGLVPIGRLDVDSRGMLLLTTDGELAHRLAHPRHGIRKRYRVRLARAASRQQLEALTAGVALDDGPARALEASRLGSGSRIELLMGEGRKREVRRLCAAVGLEVRDLLRVAIGPLHLDDLAEGRSRVLTAIEVEALSAAAGLQAQSAPALRDAG